MYRLVAIVLMIAVCSTASAFEPSGTYRGGWISNSTGHKGPMSVRISPRNDGKYDARFTGRFALIIPFTYKATMTPIEQGPGYTTMTSTKRLPLFGNYTMTATVTPCNVNATYRSKKDTGSFRMQRSR